jgi:hypothetical protein
MVLAPKLGVTQAPKVGDLAGETWEMRLGRRGEEIVRMAPDSWAAERHFCDGAVLDAPADGG